MIEYEELCAALDRYVARSGGAPSRNAPTSAAQPAAPRAPLSMSNSPARSAAPAVAAPSVYEPPTSEVELPPLEHHDELHDPDLPSLSGPHEDDHTHVGSGPLSPPPLAPAPHHDEHSNEIDIGDVLSDDEL